VKPKQSARFYRLQMRSTLAQIFREVSSLVLERAIALVGADYSALGVLDPAGGRISLAAFKAAPHASIEQVQGLFDEHGQSLDVTAFPAMVEVLAQGKTLRLLEN
jgi:hypothetical protein